MQTDPVAEFYGAWNQRDADALARTFVDDGTFADPLCRAAVPGVALRAHFAAVAAALQELDLSVTRTLSGDDHAAVAWSLKVVCKGTLDNDLAADGTEASPFGIW